MLISEDEKAVYYYCICDFGIVAPRSHEILKPDTKIQQEL